MAISLDDIDVKLLTELQRNADRTNVQLARLVDLSPAATLNRVRRLKDSGVIKLIRADLDLAESGFPFSAYVAVSLARHDGPSTKRFTDEVLAVPQIIRCEVISGEMDFWLTVVARDVADLEHVLVRLGNRGGQRVVTYLRLSEVKPISPLPLSTSH